MDGGNGQASKDNKVLFHHNLIISQQLASKQYPNPIILYSNKKAHHFTNVS
jgi:hypothetical protein